MKRKHLFIAGGVLLVAFILGSFFDLQINQAIFLKNNGFGIFMSAFGTIPGYACLAFIAGALIPVTKKHQTLPKWFKICLYILALVAFIAAVYFSGGEVFSDNAYNIPSLEWLGYIICGVIMMPICYLGVLVGQKCDNSKAWLIILLMFAAIFVALVPGVTVLKSIFHRPRFRIAINDGYVSFHNWWEPCKEYKELINNFPNILTKEEFKSFPSGHAGASMITAMFLSYLPLFDKRLEKHQTWLFYAGFGYSLIVCFSRLLVGAHYLSDVAMGGFLTLICFYIANEIILQKCLPQKVEEVK